MARSASMAIGCDSSTCLIISTPEQYDIDPATGIGGLETVSTVTTGDYERRKRAFRQAVREWRYGSAKKNLRPWHPVNVAKRAAPDATGMNLAVEA
jgi:hypothetical protein